MRLTSRFALILYTADAYRGADVLRVDRKADPTDMPTLVAPVPEAWLGGTASTTFGPSEVWGYACLIPAGLG